MKKLKYFLTSLLLVLVSIVACGCGAVGLTTELSSSGQVRTTLAVALDGLDNVQRRNLYELLVKYSASLNESYKENLTALYANLYDYDQLNLDTVDKQFQWIKTQDTRFLTSDNFEIEPKKNWSIATDFSSFETFSIQLSFASVYGYIMFFCPKAFIYNAERKAVVVNSDVYMSLADTPVSVLDYEKIENTFTTTYLETCAPFLYNLQEPYLTKPLSLASNSKNYSTGTPLVEVACDLLGVNAQDAQYYFGFSTPYKRLHTDGTKNDAGVYVWSFGNSISGTIKLWRNTANQAMWYVVCLSCGMLVFVVGGVTCAVVKRKKTKKGMAALANIQQMVMTSSDGDKTLATDENETTHGKNMSKNETDIVGNMPQNEDYSLANDNQHNTPVSMNVLGEGAGELHDEVQKNLKDKEEKYKNKKSSKKSKKIEKE